jgi:hypothetical protein
MSSPGWQLDQSLPLPHSQRRLALSPILESTALHQPPLPLITHTMNPADISGLKVEEIAVKGAPKKK